MVVPRFPVVAGTALTLLLASCAAPALAAGSPRDGAPDRVIVAFDHTASGGNRADALQDVHATSARALPALGQTDAVTVADGSAAGAVAKLNAADGVAWAEIDRPVHAAMSYPVGWQWGLWSNLGDFSDAENDFTAAWNRSTGSAQVPIAIVDTGVDFGIRDLRDNKVDGGWDFISGDTDPSPDTNSHGTGVAGIAAASIEDDDSEDDITGGAPSAGIMALRALDSTGSGLMSTVAAAFAWAGDHGARVVNASLTSTGPSQAVTDAITAHPNTLYVVAAGNSSTDEDSLPSDKRDYPCVLNLPNVICVAAVDKYGNLASFSNYGATTVDVAGPGKDIRSYVIGGKLQSWQGTSMAAPFVAAAAELAVTHTPTVTAPQLHDAIIAGARHLDALATKTISGGMINPDDLVTRVAQLPVVAPPKPPAPPAPATPAAPAPPATTPPGRTAPSKAPVLRSPKLKLGHVKRSGKRLVVSGTVARSWKGTVTVKICAGKHCASARAHVAKGRFSVKLTVSRGHRVKVTVATPAAHGYRAANVTRTARS
jgi:subtilisin family serine protease